MCTKFFQLWKALHNFTLWARIACTPEDENFTIIGCWHPTGITLLFSSPTQAFRKYTSLYLKGFILTFPDFCFYFCLVSSNPPHHKILIEKLFLLPMTPAMLKIFSGYRSCLTAMTGLSYLCTVARLRVFQ